MMGRQQETMMAVEKEAGGGVASLLGRRVVLVAAAALTAATMALSASPASAEPIVIGDPSGTYTATLDPSTGAVTGHIQSGVSSYSVGTIDPSTGTVHGLSKSGDSYVSGGTEEGSTFGWNCPDGNGSCTGALLGPDGVDLLRLGGQNVDLPF